MRRNQAEPFQMSAATARGDLNVTSVSPSRRPYFIEKWMLSTVLAGLGHPPIAFELWDGQQIAPAGKKPISRAVIGDPGALWRLLAYPDLQFGELYSAGRIEVKGDLVRFLEAIYRARAARNPRWIERVSERLYRRNRNTLEGSRHNIHHHYDIGNEFYRLWLDDQMLYTCAYYAAETMSVEQAQVAKMHHVARKLQLRPGQTVVEAGCGWGALALHLARHYGVRVRAFNISREQLAYARARAKREGLDSQVEFVEADYREIEGQYDVFVSVGMLEHVGLDHFKDLGAVIRRSLKPEGLGLIHTIGRNRPANMNAWIEKRIFPGACPPTLAQMGDIFEPYRLSVLDVENLRMHYAKTLQHWLQRYDSSAAQIEKMFDANFVRAWRLYLAGSVAAFTTGELQLFQVVFSHADNNRVPRTREHQYAAERREGLHAVI